MTADLYWQLFTVAVFLACCDVARDLSRVRGRRVAARLAAERVEDKAVTKFIADMRGVML